jgi:hypothetical protein
MLGPLLPPSLPLVIYGVSANASIGQLFAAGIIPGLLLATCLGVGGEARHEGLRELAGPPADWTARSLADRWTARVAEAVEIVREVQPATFTGGHLPEVAARALRFRDPRWTSRR